jgi:hypothetical protein
MKNNRIELMKAIWRRLEKADALLPQHTKQVEAPVKRGRGRPRTDVVAVVAAESFNYDKLSDDAGVIIPGENDVHEERSLMGTTIHDPVAQELHT